MNLPSKVPTSIAFVTEGYTRQDNDDVVIKNILNFKKIFLGMMEHLILILTRDVVRVNLNVVLSALQFFERATAVPLAGDRPVMLSLHRSDLSLRIILSKKRDREKE